MNEERRLKTALKELTHSNLRFFEAFDEVMKQCTDRRTIKAVVTLINNLEVANDRARYFGLGLNFRTDGPARKHREAMSAKP